MKKVSIILLCTAISLISHGQDKPKSVMSFKEAVKIAIDNSVLLKQQRNQLVASKVNNASGLASLGPDLSVNGNAGRNDGNSFNQQQGQVVNGIVDFVSGSFNANMTLFNGFNGINSYRQSKYQLEAQLNSVKRTNQDIIQTVTTQYLQCLLDIALLKIDEQNVITQNNQLNRISNEVEVGSRAEVDKLAQEFQVRNAELSVLRSKNRLRNDKAALAQTLQLDPSVDFNIDDPQWDVNKIDSKEVNLDELYKTAMDNRADLKQSVNNSKALKYGFRANQGSYFPRLGAFFSYGSQYNFIKGFDDNRTFDQQFREDNVQTTYGLTISLPILNGLRTRAAVAQSKATYENSNLDMQNLKLQIKSDVLLAHQNLRDAVTNYQASQYQLESGKMTFELEQERYDLGASDLVQLTQANQSYVQAQGDMASATYTLLFQDILLNYALGTLNFEDLP